MIPISIFVKVDGSLVKETGQLLGDAVTAARELTEQVLHNYLPQLRMWAASNLMKCNDRLVEENKRRALAGLRPVPARFALPALAAIAEEDDEDMLLLWARLLANLQDGNRDDVAERLLVGILGSMEPVDALVLKFAADVERDDDRRPRIRLPIKDVASALAIDQGRLLIALHNLSRLGCLFTFPMDNSPVLEKPGYRQPGVHQTGDDAFGPMAPYPEPGPQISSSPRDYGIGPMIIRSETMIFRLTTLGIRLIDACRTADEKTTESVYMKPDAPSAKQREGAQSLSPS